MVELIYPYAPFDGSPFVQRRPVEIDDKDVVAEILKGERKPLIPGLSIDSPWSGSVLST